MKKAKLKLKFGKMRYGWIDTEINNPTNKRRNVKINHSGVFPFYQDMIEALQSLKFKRKVQVLIEEEGSETLIAFYNLGNNIKVTFIKHPSIHYKGQKKSNYNYYFRPFTCIYNKKEFVKEFKKKLWKHYLKNKEQYLDYEYWFMFSKTDFRKL